MNRIVAFGSSPILSHPGFKKGDMPFPEIIANRLTVAYDTKAKPLSSNSKISRKVLTYDFQQGDIALVSWTSTTRFEFRTEHGWTGINPATYRSEHSFGEHWYNGPGQWEYTAISMALKEIIITQNFLKQAGIPFIFLFDHDEIFESHLYNNPDAYITSLIKSIDWEHFIIFDNHGFMPWCRIKEFDFTGTHPNITAHLAAADYIIEKSPHFASKGSES